MDHVRASHLAILLEAAPQCFWVEPEPNCEVVIDGHSLTLIDAELAMFSDWIFDDEGRVIGAEIHAFTDSLPKSFFEVLHAREYVSFGSGFPCIWLTEARSGTGRAIEAFETYYATDEAGRWTVLVPVRGWLSEGEADALAKLVELW